VLGHKEGAKRSGIILSPSSSNSQRRKGCGSNCGVNVVQRGSGEQKKQGGRITNGVKLTEALGGGPVEGVGRGDELQYIA